ncbi:MAG: hypothetical protein MJA27_20925 [Pseudanabaenales cyanobacterium]|nr:hypothetical protein [Pseudanabaenales cyanobacterium]
MRLLIHQAPRELSGGSFQASSLSAWSEGSRAPFQQIAKLRPLVGSANLDGGVLLAVFRSTSLPIRLWLTTPNQRPSAR